MLPAGDARAQMNITLHCVRCQEAVVAYDSSVNHERSLVGLLADQAGLHACQNGGSTDDVSRMSRLGA